MSNTRTETDSLGSIEVPADKYWGAQTERALLHFPSGNEIMPKEIIHALALIKKAAAQTNTELGQLAQNKAELIVTVCDEIIDGKLDEHFPLSIWQSGSGTQTNMNINEVIANRAAETQNTKGILHPNDDVNKSQSTNDVFPTAIHLAAYKLIIELLLPNLTTLKNALTIKQNEFATIIKIGRTHLQDAVSLTLGEEFSGYVAQLEICLENINFALSQLKQLALGGTAVGTGLNAHPKFSELAIKKLSHLTGIDFIPAKNKFAALAAHEAIVITSSALKNLATALYKIANDIRWLASGPRCGIGELILPENEPGSSIMPGKINPTQCEMVLMICAQIIGNDAVITFANTQGNFELNVFKPVIAYNLIQAIKLLGSACNTFAEHAIKDLHANITKIKFYRENSLMHVTELAPKIGYDKAAKIAQLATANNITLKEACLELKYLTAAEFDAIINLKK